MRTFFQDEILAVYKGSTAPQYKLQQNAEGGTEILLLNPIAQAGTRLNASTFNNLYDFDNMAMQAECEKRTVFAGNGNITERLVEAITGAVVAERETEFMANGAICVTEQVYGNGAVVRRTRHVTVFKTTGDIEEEVIDI